MSCRNKFGTSPASTYTAFRTLKNPNSQSPIISEHSRDFWDEPPVPEENEVPLRISGFFAEYWDDKNQRCYYFDRNKQCSSWEISVDFLEDKVSKSKDLSENLIEKKKGIGEQAQHVDTIKQTNFRLRRFRLMKSIGSVGEKKKKKKKRAFSILHIYRKNLVNDAFIETGLKNILQKLR